MKDLLKSLNPIVISRTFIEDSNLSWKTKGFFVHLVANYGDILKTVGDISDEELDPIYEELIENGYARYDKEKNVYHYTDVKDKE